MAQVDIQADLSKLLNDLSRVESAVQSLQSEMRKTGQVGQQAFDGAATESHQFLEDVNLVGEAMRKAGQQVKSLDDYLAHLERQQKRTNDPVMVRKYADEIGRTRKALAEIKAAGYDAEFGKINKGATVGTTIFAKMAGALAAIGGLQAISQLATDALSASDDFKKASASFTAFLGSKEKASDFIGQMDNLAGKLGLSTDAVRSASKSLLAFGEDQSNIEPVMRRIADLSAATGKDFNELALIYGKARTQGVLYAEDINQLTEAGIPIMDEFAKILGTSASNVKKLASEGKIGFADLEKAFANLTAEGTKFGGLASKQAKEFGAVTSATSAWRGALVEIGNILSPIRNLWASFSGSIANGITNLLNPTKAVNLEFEQQKKQIIDIQAQVPGFLARYDELQGRQNLTKTEQAQLNEALNALGTLVPGAVTAVNEYGQVLDINRGKITEFTAAQQENFKELSRIRGEQAAEQIEILRKQIEAEQKITSGALKKGQYSGGAVSLVDYSDAERLASRNRIADLREQLGVQQQILQASKNSDPAKLLADQQKSEADAAAKANADRLKAQEEAERAARRAAAERAAKQAKENAEFVDAAEIAAMEDGLKKQLALEDFNFKKSLDGKDFNKKQLEILEEIHQQNIREIIAKSAAAELEKAQELADEEERLRKEADAAEGKDRLDKLEAIKANGERQVALNEENQKSIILSLKKLGATDEQVKKAQEQFDLESQKARLQNELSFQEALLEITDAGDTARINEIAGNIELLKSKVRNAQGEIDNLSLPAKKKGGNDAKSFLENIVGRPVTDDELKAITEAADQFVTSINQIADAQVEAAQIARDAADTRVDAAKDALDQELELSKQGFASNVSLRQKELADAEAAQQKAIEMQRKAAKTQFALDTVTQTVSLVTASANIFKSLSGIPVIGVPLAVAAIATMFTAFAAARANAAKATKFRHGGSGYVDQNGVIVGNSHENGGVTVPEYEGGEFFGSDGKRFAVVNKRLTGKHFDLLTAINRDDRDGIRRHAFGLTGGVSVKREAFEAGTRPISAVPAVVGGTDRSEEVSLLREQNRHLKTLVDRKQIHDMGDYFLVIEGDKQTKIQKNG